MPCAEFIFYQRYCAWCLMQWMWRCRAKDDQVSVYKILCCPEIGDNNHHPCKRTYSCLEHQPHTETRTHSPQTHADTQTHRHTRTHTRTLSHTQAHTHTHTHTPVSLSLLRLCGHLELVCIGHFSSISPVHI